MNFPLWTGASLKPLGQLSVLFLYITGILPITTSAEISIDLQTALNRTLAGNPELKAFPSIIRGSEAMQLQADITPNPELGLEIENVLGSGNFQKTDNAEISLTLSQLVELGDKKANRLKFASAETQKLKSEYDLVRLDILAETSRRYYQILFFQEHQKLLTIRAMQEKDSLTSIQQRANAGASGQAEVSKMQLRHTRSFFQQTKLNDELKIAKSRLAAMWMTEVDFSRVLGNLSQVPKLLPMESIAKSVEKMPNVLHHQILRRVAESQFQLEKVNGRSNLRLGLGVKQHQSTSDQSLSFSFSMPLSLQNPNMGQIKASQSRLNLSLQQIDWSKRQLTLTLVRMRQHIDNLHSQLKMLKIEILPQAEKLLGETMRGYHTGHYSVLQWVDAQSELFHARQTIIDVYYQIYLAILEVERISGHRVTKAPATISGEK